MRNPDPLSPDLDSLALSLDRLLERCSCTKGNYSERSRILRLLLPAEREAIEAANPLLARRTREYAAVVKKTRDNLKKKQKKAETAGLPIPPGEAPFEEPLYGVNPQPDGTLSYTEVPANLVRQPAPFLLVSQPHFGTLLCQLSLRTALPIRVFALAFSLPPPGHISVRRPRASLGRVELSRYLRQRAVTVPQLHSLSRVLAFTPMEKQDLPPPTTAQPPAPPSLSTAAKYRRVAFALLAPLLLLTPLNQTRLLFPSKSQASRDVAPNTCFQPPAIVPSSGLLTKLEGVYASPDFVLRAADWLGAAVRVNTEVGDKFGEVGEDPVWDKFADFHAYLEKSFPLVYKYLPPFKVNSWGLVFEWTGSDPSLKPILLTGHQDTVPVEPSTVDQWKEPPFSGKYDGTFIWGRGSCDDKSGTIGIFSSLETLLEAGFEPARTIVFASGFDEEVTGPRGAGHLGVYLEKTYGTNGFAFLLDEGGGFSSDEYGIALATPSTGEKGQSNIEVTVQTVGGHSSRPPDHTSIGLLALVVASIERNPHTPLFSRQNPYYSQLVCAAEFGTTIPPHIERLIEKSKTSDGALKALGAVLGKDRDTRTFVTTTQAIDLIEGGVKVNALPEKASAVINNRINVDSSYQAVEDRLIQTVLPTVAEYNLQLNGFGKLYSPNTTSPAAGLVTLSEWVFRKPLNPAPISPTGEDVPAWKLLAGTIKSVYSTRPNASTGEAEIVVSPSINGGNTDTKYYWNLTPNIYRYGHLDRNADSYVASGVHSVNEAIRATGFVGGDRKSVV